MYLGHFQMSNSVIIFGRILYICRSDRGSRINRVRQSHGISENEGSEIHSSLHILLDLFSTKH